MAKTLLIAELDGGSLSPSTLPAITFAQSLVRQGGGGFDILAAGGADVEGQAVRDVARHVRHR